MKKAIKRLLQVGSLVGAFVGGIYANDMSKNIETPVQAETVKTDELKAEQGFNLATIPNDKDNIFTQYFTVSEIKDNVIYVTNTYFKDDFQIVEKSDLASLKYEVGTKLAITYNHDDIQEIEYDNHKTYIYNITDSKEYGIELDNEKYVFGVNPLDSADFVTLEKKTYVIGDMVKVTYKEGNNVEIEQDSKIGRWREAEEEIQKNDVATASQNVEKDVEKLVQQNTEIVKENETLKNAVKQETQKIEKVKQNEEKPKSQNEQKVNNRQQSKQENTKIVNKEEKQKTEQKQVSKQNNSSLEKDPNEGKQGYIKDGNGKWITESEYDDMAFKENAETDPNRNNPNYVQTEDGSFVPKNFWD